MCRHTHIHTTHICRHKCAHIKNTAYEYTHPTHRYACMHVTALYGRIHTGMHMCTHTRVTQSCTHRCSPMHMGIHVVSHPHMPIYTHTCAYKDNKCVYKGAHTNMNT